MAVWAKNVAVFGKRKLGQFLADLAPKVAVSDLELLETLNEINNNTRKGEV